MESDPSFKKSIGPTETFILSTSILSAVVFPFPSFLSFRVRVGSSHSVGVNRIFNNRIVQRRLLYTQNHVAFHFAFTVAAISAVLLHAG